MTGTGEKKYVGRATLEALRKHREKRRAKISDAIEHVLKGESTENKSSLDNEKSTPQNINGEKIIKTIVATESQIEDMRKISKLGLEDPVDVAIAANSNSREEEMVKTQSSRRHKAAKVMPEPDKKRGQNVVAGDEDCRPLKSSTKNSNFVPPPCFDDISGNPPQCVRGRRRARSFDEEGCILDMEVVVSTPDPLKIKSRSRSLDDDEHCLYDDEDETPGLKAPALVIEPTEEQQELMRKVSALGLEDPVFGRIHDQFQPKHASEMSDMNATLSDRTNSVEADGHHYEPSVPRFANRSPAARGQNNNPADNSDGNQPFVPPQGSFIRRISKRNIKKQEQPQESPPTSSTTHTRKSSPRSDRSTKSSTELCFETNQLHNFIPPSGSFNLKKNRKDVPTSPAGSLMRDMELAAEAESLYPDFLGKDVTKMLSQSISSLNFDDSMSMSALNDSLKDEERRPQLKGNRSFPTLPRNRPQPRRINPNDKQGFVPPPPPPPDVVKPSPVSNVPRNLPKSIDVVLAFIPPNGSFRLKKRGKEVHNSPSPDITSKGKVLDDMELAAEADSRFLDSSSGNDVTKKLSKSMSSLNFDDSMSLSGLHDSLKEEECSRPKLRENRSFPTLPRNRPQLRGTNPNDTQGYVPPSPPPSDVSTPSPGSHAPRTLPNSLDVLLSSSRPDYKAGSGNIKVVSRERPRLLKKSSSSREWNGDDILPLASTSDPLWSSFRS